MTRKEAVEYGLEKYNNGKICKKGHMGYRFNKSGACVECVHEAHKRHYEKEKEKILKVNKKNAKKRYNDDVFFRYKHRLPCMLSDAIRNGGYSEKTKLYKILGCSYNEFISYLIFNFDNGMSFNNREKWKIITRTSLKTASTIEELESLYYYTNLIPVWK